MARTNSIRAIEETKRLITRMVDQNTERLPDESKLAITAIKQATEVLKEDAKLFESIGQMEYITEEDYRKSIRKNAIALLALDILTDAGFEASRDAYDLKSHIENQEESLRKRETIVLGVVNGLRKIQNLMNTHAHDGPARAIKNGSPVVAWIGSGAYDSAKKEDGDQQSVPEQDLSSVKEPLGDLLYGALFAESPEAYEAVGRELKRLALIVKTEGESHD